MKGVEERLDIVHVEAAEGDTDIRRRGGDESNSVLIEKMNAQLLRVDAVYFHQHEIAAVKGIDALTVSELRLIRDLEDTLGANA